MEQKGKVIRTEDGKERGRMEVGKEGVDDT
jgi:hypothetical protein